MFGLSSLLIENYLREASFWHVATIGWGCKFDQKLIHTLIERWRPETHTFHLSCGECTIILEDVQLQLELLVDGSALIEPVQFANWGAVCYDLLGAIPDNIYGGRIEMSWLRDTFLEPGNDSTEVERIRYARAYILEMIEGYLMPNLSRNLVHLMWLLKLVDFRAAGEFSWGFAVLEILFREMCGVTPLNKAKIGEYVKIWEKRYDHIPAGESIIIPELVCVPDYMPWRKDDGMGPSTVLTQSSSPTLQPMTPTAQPLQVMPGTHPSPYMYPNPYMFAFPSPIPGWNA
ncbi:serine/threonine-protein phosphatase 7 long form homolog [Gossypium raimondii]|uniref:serine/threonine-protein phosphatase 7 long form homolog n=1 Tax=Gossypium raimondii TaxID=29730 RepID=UPI00063AC982|nr:serine/threonine-protein phosphatase 7 long form homolog [Gossypium raimondii]